MKSSITSDEKLQLLGLLTLGQQHYRIIHQVSEAMTKIVGEDDSLLHDAIWDHDTNFEKLLTDVGIEITDATT